jgi:hypothetical protein
VWVEVNLSEIMKDFYDVPSRNLEQYYSIKVDRDLGHIIFVPHRGFDFEKTKLVTYDQYIAMRK